MNTGLSYTEINRLSQQQDEKGRIPVLKALTRYLNEKGDEFVIEENNEEYGAYDFTLELKGIKWYCEVKQRSGNYHSKSCTGDFYTVKKRNSINAISTNQLFFASFPSDQTILVYDVNRTINEKKCDMTVINTENKTVNKGFDFVDKSFYNLHKRAS